MINNLKLASIVSIGLLALFGCEKPQDNNSVNIIVTNKDDTLGTVNYPKISGYEFFSNEEKESIFLNPNTLSKLPGDFGFGIRSNDLPMTSCWLVFQEVGETKLKDEVVPRVPFLYDEYKIKEKFKVNLIYNYVDSLQESPMMYQVYAAVNIENSSDTVLFQETTYLIQNGNRFAALIVYSDKDKREEMRKEIDVLTSTVTSSYEK